MAATRHRQLAVGGIIKKPKVHIIVPEKGPALVTSLIQRAPKLDDDGNVVLDANGNPVPGEIIWEEHWQDPDVRAMEWEVDRLDPNTYVRRPRSR
jgi:hypothetical protein